MGTKLRSGYTTGACAAAAAAAAATALLTREPVERVEILFPDGSTVGFTLSRCTVSSASATAAVVKDGGDDPDVTNGALICATVSFSAESTGDGETVTISGGTGVGVVTKPGLAVAVGQPAINPVPLRMIRENVKRVRDRFARSRKALAVTIEVPDGLELAGRTLNARLGIIGGISILGTTGIVRPISAEAWTATIRSCMDVAEANNVSEIVLSTGRTSERCVQQKLGPPEEALVMMGDYLEFSLKEVRQRSFRRVHVATMWAKLLKGALGYGQTHVRHGVLDTAAVCSFLEDHGSDPALVGQLRSAHTAREILDILVGTGALEVIGFVLRHAAERYRKLCGLPVTIHLVDGHGVLIMVSDGQ